MPDSKTLYAVCTETLRGSMQIDYNKIPLEILKGSVQKFTTPNLLIDRNNDLTVEDEMYLSYEDEYDTSIFKNVNIPINVFLSHFLIIGDIEDLKDYVYNDTITI